MHVDAARLSVMDLAAHYCRVSIRLHLETCYPVPVDVAAFKVALQREPESQENQTRISVFAKFRITYYSHLKCSMRCTVYKFSVNYKTKIFLAKKRQK